MGAGAQGAGVQGTVQSASASKNTNTDPIHTIKIPAQSLASALQVLASQTGIQIAFFSEDVAEFGTDAVEGRYSVRQVLELLLEQTGLDFDLDDGIIVYPAVLVEPVAAEARDASMPKGGESSMPDHASRFGSAPPGSADEKAIEEVIVTGGLHEIVPMDSPQSMTILASDLLKEMRASNITDIHTLVTGFNVRNMQDGEYRYNIRGITSQTGIDGFAPVSAATAVYLDGTPVTSALGPQTQTAGLLFDIDRIEVLKGPQGTLLGESSLAGMVRYVYEQPDVKQIDTAVSASMSDVSFTNEISGHVNAMVNLPITENTALRLAGWRIQEAGFIDNLPPGELDTNDGRTSGGRGSFRYGTDRITLTGSIYYGKQETLGGSATVHPYLSLNEHLPGKQPFSRDTVTIYSLDVEANLQWATLRSMTSFASRAFGANTETTPNARTEIDFIWGGARKVEDSSICRLSTRCPDFPGIFNLANPDAPSTIGDGMNLRIFNELADHSSKRRVQELHLASPVDQALRWTLGLFWKDGEDANSDIADVLYYPGRKNTFGNLFDAIRDPAHNIHTDTAKEYAVFGEIHRDITDRWEITMGLRTSNIRQHFSVANRHTEDNSLTGRFVLSWRPNNDLLAYFSVATGYRPGNVNGHMEFVADLYERQLEQTQGNTDTMELLTKLRSRARSRRFFDGDKVTHHEVGIKAMPFGDDMRLVAAAYFARWEDMIVLEQDPLLRDHIEPISTFNINSGGADIHGIEFEVSTLLTDRLRVRFTADTNNSKITRGPLFGDVIARGLNPTPGWSASLVMDYIQSLTKNLTLHHHLSHAQVGEQGDIRSHHKTNGRVVLRSQGGRWYLALFANNLTDENLVSDVQSETLWWHNPRQVGLEFGYETSSPRRDTPRGTGNAFGLMQRRN